MNEIDRLRALFTECSHPEALADLAALEKRLAELERDRERLDWLETRENGSLQSCLYLGGPWLAQSDGRPPLGLWKFTDRRDLGSYASIRYAIDAARAGEEKR